MILTRPKKRPRSLSKLQVNHMAAIDLPMERQTLIGLVEVTLVGPLMDWEGGAVCKRALELVPPIDAGGCRLAGAALDSFTIDSPISYRVSGVVRTLSEETERMITGSTEREKQGPFFGKLTQLFQRLRVRLSCSLPARDGRTALNMTLFFLISL